MKPILSRKQLSELLKKQFKHFMRHNPQITFDEEWGYLPFFDFANNLFFRRCSDRYRILQKWLEPEAAKYPRTKPQSPTIKVPDIYLDIEHINSYLSGKYLFRHEYKGNIEDAELNGKFVLKYPSLLFYLLARASEMEEYDIICAFDRGEGLDFGLYEMYCVYDIFEYYYKKSGLTETALSKLIHKKGYSPQSISILLGRKKFISLENFSVLAEALQIPDKWKRFGQCCLAHQQDSFFYLYGYKKAMQEHSEPRCLYPLLQGQADKGQLLDTLSQLYDYLGYTVLKLPPSWEDKGNCDDTAVLGIMKPDKKMNRNSEGTGKGNMQNGNIYKMQLGCYKAILEDVAEYAEFVLEKALRQQNS